MKQTVLNKKILKAMVLIGALAMSLMAPSANDVTGKTAANYFAQEKLFALQIIEPVIVFNKQMIKSVKLAAFDNKYSRVDLTLTTKASEQLAKTGKLKKNQKMVFTINNQIIEALVIQKAMNEEFFLISITTSKKNAELIIKAFS